MPSSFSTHTSQWTRVRVPSRRLLAHPRARRHRLVDPEHVDELHRHACRPRPSRGRSGPASPATTKQVDIIPCTTMFGKPSFCACSRVGVVVARRGPRTSSSGARPRSSSPAASSGPVAVGNGAAGGARLLARRGLVDDEAALPGALARRQEGLVRAAAHQQPAVVGRAEVGLVHDVVAAALARSARRSSSACAPARRSGSARRAPSPGARAGSRTGSSGTTRRGTCSTRSGGGAAARARRRAGCGRRGRRRRSRRPRRVTS